MAEPLTLNEIQPTERQLRALRRITGKASAAEAVSEAIDLVVKQDVEDRDLQRRLTKKVREWDQQSKPIDDWDAMMRKALRTARRA